jgi:hypothetical protein
MPDNNEFVNQLLDTIVDAFDIPKSYYEKAAARHQSLGEWLCRAESKVAAFKPHISPQGSFRCGTVNRPILPGERYDLDNVTVLAIAKTSMSQKALKHLYGDEIKSYAKAQGIVAPVEEKDRCWRLVYADEVDFHMDTLPCAPEEPAVILALTAAGVSPNLARRAVAITDRRHRNYELISSDLPSSNPRGFAVWFVERARPYALERMRQLVATRLYASVEDVPPYEWKTPLQRSIQFLKRHRDVMFYDSPEPKPISMVITNLSAHAYGGESDLWSALRTIVQNMPRYVNPRRPRIPNPADPREDYADKWAENPALEESFWTWHAQVSADLETLPSLNGTRNVDSTIRRMLRVSFTDAELRRFQGATREPAILVSAPTVIISNPARPWSGRK